MRVFYFILIVGLLLAACSGNDPLPQSKAIDPAKPTLLIAMLKGSNSPFKLSLIDSLSATYGDSCNVVTTYVSSFADLQGKEHDVLLVMDKLKAGMMFNKPFKEITENADKQKSLFFLSTGDPDWVWRGAGDKLITSATDKVSPQKVLSRLRKLIDTALASRRAPAK